MTVVVLMIALLVLVITVMVVATEAEAVLSCCRYHHYDPRRDINGLRRIALSMEEELVLMVG
jgi:hypothetical protein